VGTLGAVAGDAPKRARDQGQVGRHRLCEGRFSGRRTSVSKLFPVLHCPTAQRSTELEQGQPGRSRISSRPFLRSQRAIYSARSQGFQSIAAARANGSTWAEPVAFPRDRLAAFPFTQQTRWRQEALPLRNRGTESTAKTLLGLNPGPGTNPHLLRPGLERKPARAITFQGEGSSRSGWPAPRVAVIRPAGEYRPGCRALAPARLFPGASSEPQDQSTSGIFRTSTAKKRYLPKVPPQLINFGSWPLAICLKRSCSWSMAR